MENSDIFNCYVWAKLMVTIWAKFVHTKQNAQLGPDYKI